MFWQIRRLSDGALMETYESPSQIIKGGELGDETRFIHLPVPEGFDPGVVDFNAGGGSPYLEVNSDRLAEWKRQRNAVAKAEFATAKEAETDQTISAMIDGNAETTVLMIALNNAFEYIKALQVAAGITDEQLGETGQAAKADAQALQTNIYSAVQALRASRDAAVAAFIPPHGDVEPLYPTE